MRMVDFQNSEKYMKAMPLLIMSQKTNYHIEGIKVPKSSISPEYGSFRHTLYLW